MDAETRQRSATKYGRVRLTDDLRRRFAAAIFERPVPEVVKRTGLPYLLVYNVIKGRVKTVTEREYRLLFGEDPPERSTVRVAAVHFRQMVRLWLYLNPEMTKRDLYNELFAGKRVQKPDYRLFSGRIHTVSPRVVKAMAQKFSDSGIDHRTMRRWMADLSQMPVQLRVPYKRVRPHLLFLEAQIGIHPNMVLRQQFDRYETGRLKHVSQDVFEFAQTLRKAAEEALASGDRREVQRLRERVYGGKAGYVLYVELADELHFLKKIGKMSPKRFLGRSTAAYEQGKVKRIAAWRAAKIRQACRDLVAARPSIAIEGLPQALRIRHLALLMSVLLQRATALLSQAEGAAVEKQILMPSRHKMAYGQQVYGFTRFDKASTSLGMKQKAFDLMVARNCDIFRKVGKYTRRWYLSDLYLKELAARSGFNLVSAKYEILSRRLTPSEPTAEPMDRCRLN